MANRKVGEEGGSIEKAQLRVRRQYGHWIVLAAFLNPFFSVGIVYYGFPVFYPSMVDSLGFTRSQLTQGFLVGFVFVGLLACWQAPLSTGRDLDM